MSEDPRRAIGAMGESLACRHLEARGYEIVQRNYRTRYGELDVIAADRRRLVFCEVKTRIVRGLPGRPGAAALSPLASVGVRKQRQVRAMAREWLAQEAGSGEAAARPRPPELRFDAIGISLDPAGRLVELEHLEGAF